MFACRNFECTAAWHDTFVLHSIPDSTKTVPDGFLGLSNLVVVWTLDEDGAREWVLDALDERVLVITEHLLIDMLGETKILLSQVLDRVHLSATACQWDTLTISLFASTDTNDLITSKDLKRWWINTLLVDDDEAFVGAFAELSLQLDDLLDLVVGELSLRGNELFSLLGIGPEESRVDLSLLILEGHIKAKNVAVLH